jgi:hypothetical protein
VATRQERTLLVRQRPQARKHKRCCDTVPVDPTRRSTPTDAGGTTQAYELDITLVGVRPRIFRRLAIAADATFGDLHHAIQLACGRDDHHLFAFTTPTTTSSRSPTRPAP